MTKQPHAPDAAAPGPAHERLNLEQRRARDAWKVVATLVRDHSSSGPDKRTKADDVALGFARQSRKLPYRVMAAGVGQAIVFVYSKSGVGKHKNQRTDAEKANCLLLRELARWLLGERLGLRPERHESQPESAIIELLTGTIPNVKANSALIRFVTSEMVAYLSWMNRFLAGQGWSVDDMDDGEATS
ncbi:MAG: type III-B CRISPR module-associated protein Cmr5 [Phycisphaerales bacterium]|nr:type III-B CRISPR module-associated protein Cmr5 [Phycisphaerales bacterium]